MLPTIAAVAYLGCNGDSEDPLDPTSDSGAETSVDRRSPDPDVVVDSSTDAYSDTDGGLDADADAATDADADDGDAGLFKCSVMNSDGGAYFGDAACNTCMSDNCCDDVTACFGYDDCVARVACVRACDGGAACKNECKNNHPDSGTQFAAVSLCLTGTCTDPALECAAFP